MEALLRRNMEYSQTITDYQRKLREHAQSVQTAEEHSRKLSIEVLVPVVECIMYFCYSLFSSRSLTVSAAGPGISVESREGTSC